VIEGLRRIGIKIIESLPYRGKHSYYNKAWLDYKSDQVLNWTSNILTYVCNGCIEKWGIFVDIY
jgi:hypothetical protein